MNEHFSDVSTYVPVVERTYRGKNVDINLSSQRQINEWISRMEQLGYFDSFLATKLRTHNSSIASAYGLFKIHKAGNPLRIIIPSFNSPTYSFAKYVSDVLSNVLGHTPHHIKNSCAFRERVYSVKLPRNHNIASIDIVSMFTNMPRDLIKDSIKIR